MDVENIGNTRRVCESSWYFVILQSFALVGETRASRKLGETVLVIFLILHQYNGEIGVDCLILLAINCLVVEITVIFLLCLFLFALLLACAYQHTSQWLKNTSLSAQNSPENTYGSTPARLPASPE